LRGSIPGELGNLSSLVWFDITDNEISGSIPVSNGSNLGLDMLKKCQHLRLDRNQLTGAVPSNLNNLSKLAELDLSNNSFDLSDVPPWFSTLPSLTTLYYYTSLCILLSMHGRCHSLTCHPFWLQSVGVLEGFRANTDISFRLSPDAEGVKLSFSGFMFGIHRLEGNPYCDQQGSVSKHCNVEQQSNPATTYSTPVQNCGAKVCSSDQEMSPICICSYPYEGTIVFRFLTFSNTETDTYYQIIETALYKSFQDNQVPVSSLSLQNPKINVYNYFQVDMWIFPSSKVHFDEPEVVLLSNLFSNITFKSPDGFGPYYFIAKPYPRFAGKISCPCILYLLLCQTVSDILTSILNQSDTCDTLICHSSWEQNQVYRGALDDGQLIAVKRAQQGSLQGDHEFKTEIEMLSRVHHRNLVGLVGFCFDHNEQILVYEYIPNGSLRDSLSDADRSLCSDLRLATANVSGKSGVHLDWKKRLRIALDAARGLTYLHELANPRIIHRDVKSNNILLDHHLNAKVSDFGLCKPLTDDLKGYITTQVKGTMGYLDPEYYMTQHLTEKSDVYSFGVLLLELVTARKPIERGRFIVREVRNAINKSPDLHDLRELLDPAVCMNSTLPGLDRFIELAMKCVEESSADRPWMSEVAKEIENIMVLAGMNPYVASESNSASFGGERRSHPYQNDVSFDYSGGPYSPKVEPK
ncbi:hypothetical protein BHE74_00008700, partial [Ensete ventricosum]